MTWQNCPSCRIEDYMTGAYVIIDELDLYAGTVTGEDDTAGRPSAP